jgi:pimeloyl-ACP methyl ester carboxylesterase
VLGVAATGAGVIGAKFHPAEAADVNSIISSTPSLILMFMASAENFLGDMTWPRFYLSDSGLPLVPQVESYCVEPIATSAFDLTRPKPTAATLAQRAQFVVGARPGSGPVLLMHGTADPLMMPAYMYAWATDACRLGHQTIDLVYEDGAGHAPLDAFAQTTIEQWMLDRVNGVTPAPTNCANLPVR